MYNHVNVVLSEVSQTVAEEEELHGAIVSAGALRSARCVHVHVYCTAENNQHAVVVGYTTK